MEAPESNLHELKAVLVTNISPNATEKTVSDFFSFCGKINLLKLQREEDNSQRATVVFDTESAAKTALLLTNALIVDRPIAVSPFQAQGNESISPELLPIVQEIEDERRFDDEFSHQTPKSGSNLIASLLAAGYTLGEDVFIRAKDYDEKISFSGTIKARVNEISNDIDNSLGITQKAEVVKQRTSSTLKDVDEKIPITQTTDFMKQIIENAGESAYVGLTGFAAKAEQLAPISSVLAAVRSFREQVSAEVDVQRKEREVRRRSFVGVQSAPPVEGEEIKEATSLQTPE